MSSVSEAKMCASERLSVFVLKVWGAVAKVAAVNAQEAKQIMSEHHIFGGAWESGDGLTVENHGWDAYEGFADRVNGTSSRILSFTPAPPPVDTMAPESACKAPEYNEASDPAD